MFVRTFLLLSAVSVVPVVTLAADPSSTPGDTTRSGIFWKWDLTREWSSEYRRAHGSIQTFSDAAATTPLAVENLRFTLEIDCPSAGKPERATFEAKEASIVDAEVTCADVTEGAFAVAWEFDAQDERTGPVHDQGTWE
jgi:hypothetical protein